MILEKIQHELMHSLDEKRYEHTLGVMYTAAALCMQHSIPVEKGMLAGLLHDCAKAYKVNEQYQLCDKYKIKLNKIELVNGALVHAKLGAFLAQEHYKIVDEDILNAIRYHTTGKPGMTLLEKILYIADYIEPHRELPHVIEMRKLAFEDLDKALSCLLKLSIEHLRESGKTIDDMTVQTYEYYKTK